MSSTIKTPAMPEPEGKIAYTGASYEADWISSQNAFSEDQLAARDAQWQEMVGPVVEALAKIAAIENKEYGADWEEIEEAREIAEAALSAITEE